MLFVRFLPMFATLAIAGSLAAKKKVAVSSGTLPTHNAMFIFLLIFVVLLVGALSFPGGGGNFGGKTAAEHLQAERDTMASRDSFG